MKTKLRLTLACLLAVTARAQVVTLVATNGPSSWQIVEPWQTAEVISTFPSRGGVVYVEKDGIIASGLPGDGFPLTATIVGPARVKINGGSFMAQGRRI